jgi:hypothetical protein
MQVVGQKLDLTENIKVINTVQELVDLGSQTKA